jgi:beta-lactamase regulating signal transducer with metallopeptidase domain
MSHIEFASRFLVLWSWQALILLAVTGSIRVFDRSRSPALRYRLWLAGLMAVSVLPVWNTIGMLLPPSNSQHSTAPLAVVRLTVAPVAAHSASNADEPTRGPDKPLVSSAQAGWAFLFAAWLTGFCICLVRLGLSYRTLHRLRQTARPADWPAALGNSQGATLAISDEVEGPLVAGIRHPLVLLPARMAEWTTDDERLAILRHEVAHIQRRDQLVNFFQKLFGAVFFFHPVVRYSLRQLNLERELACDHDVVNAGCNPEVYANTILKVAQRAIDRRQAHQPAFNPSKKILERRLHMIFENRMPISKTRRVVVVARTVVMLGAVTWLMLPQSVATATRAPLAMAPSFATTITAPPAEQALLAGRLFGSISDPVGALLPGAKITLTKDSGIQQSTYSNVEGAFEFAQLQPGFYNVLVTAPGFQNFQLASVSVEQGNSREVNVNLRVGAITQHVEVSVL